MLFIAQRRGTGKVGGLFGPIIVVWFTVIGLLGLHEIVRHPMIMWALNPYYGINLLIQDPGAGFVLLGAVVLAGDRRRGALKPRMGISAAARSAARLAALCVSGATSTTSGALFVTARGGSQPVLPLAPDWAGAAGGQNGVDRDGDCPVQAVISGAFSLTHQAVQLGFLPRMNVRHTSEREMGQVYVPAINNMLLVAVAATVPGHLAGCAGRRLRRRGDRNDDGDDGARLHPSAPRHALAAVAPHPALYAVLLR